MYLQLRLVPSIGASLPLGWGPRRLHRVASLSGVPVRLTSATSDYPVVPDVSALSRENSRLGVLQSQDFVYFLLQIGLVT